MQLQMNQFERMLTAGQPHIAHLHVTEEYLDC